MKKIIFLSLVFGLLTVACKPDKKEQKAESKIESSSKDDVKKSSPDTQNPTHKVDLSKSKITWKGYKPTGTHNGLVNLKEGGVEYEGNKIKNAYFIFDMKSITCLDIPADDDYNQKLVKHLNSPDFFDTENHPTAMFTLAEITGDAGQTNFVGDLTLKGITKSVSFPVNITEVEGGLQVSAKPFMVDRTEFNIQYKSKKFFDNLKDKFINDKFEIAFDISLK